jgi:DNA-binding response OmpR family regulator
MRVLVVDDDLAVGGIAARILEQAGYVSAAFTPPPHAAG